MMEQRKNLRFPVKFRSSFSSTGLIGGEGRIVDLSIRGCHIESSINAQPGASLDVRIQAIEGEPPMHIQAAIVRWSRGGRFGVEFEVMAPAEWALLQDMVRRIELEPYEQDKQAADALVLPNDPIPHHSHYAGILAALLLQNVVACVQSLVMPAE